MTSNAHTLLRDMIERWESLDKEKKSISDDQKECLDNLKDAGFNIKAVRRILALRKIDRESREQIEALTDEYLAVLEGNADEME